MEKIFNPLVDHIPQFISRGASEAEGLESQKELEHIREDVKATPSLDLSKIAYAKEPREEQGVIAIFHELLGAGLIKGYHVLRSSAREQYDAFVNYKISGDDLPPKARARLPKGRADYECFVEFKYEASGILADLEDKKRARDIRLLVCWTIAKDKFEKQNIEVEEISSDDSIFIGSTHKLTFSNRYQFGADNLLHVICLKTLVSRIKAGNS